MIKALETVAQEDGGHTCHMETRPSAQLSPRRPHHAQIILLPCCCQGLTPPRGREWGAALSCPCRAQGAQPPAAPRLQEWGLALEGQRETGSPGPLAPSGLTLTEEEEICRKWGAENPCRASHTAPIATEGRGPSATCSQPCPPAPHPCPTPQSNHGKLTNTFYSWSVLGPDLIVDFLNMITVCDHEGKTFQEIHTK